MDQLEKAIKDSVKYLNSKEAKQSLDRDVYWPKWDSPWWHILLLNELGLVHQVPKSTMKQLIENIHRNFLHFFPLTEEEMPLETDPYRQTLCLCMAGSLYQMLHNYGLNVDAEIPWLREWFTKYQLPDGGFNCNEEAYAKETPKSSMTSTLPVLEALLLAQETEVKEDELEVLNRGADYIVKHKLFRKLSNQEVMDPNFVEIRFPRFYEYDYLRGFKFLYDFRQKYGYNFPDAITNEVEKMVEKQLVDGFIKTKGIKFTEKSYNPTSEGKWELGPASYFELMNTLMEPNRESLFLTKQWNDIKPKYLKVIKSYESTTNTPIHIRRGHEVKVIKKDLEHGWFLCKTEDGREGWAPNKILHGSIVTQSYDGTELTVQVGEVIKVYYEETNWYWSKNKQGIEGWVPKEHVESILN
jgi:hypothetical protein